MATAAVFSAPMGAAAAVALCPVPALASAGTQAARAGSASSAVARTARTKTISLNEHGSLHLTKKHGFTLYERGSASGTIKGTIYITLKLTSSKRVSANVNISPAGGGWMSGTGAASYSVKGAYAYFTGSMSITKAGGSWTGSRASGLRFSGRIKRRGDSVTVSLSGKLRAPARAHSGSSRHKRR